MTSIPKISAFLACLLVVCVSLTGCLGGSEAETIITNWQNVTIKSFSFVDNKDVCSGLSKYNFTIDNFGESDPVLAAKMPGAGIIFNPDSLPVGTVPDSITIKMETADVSSAVFTQYDWQGFLARTVNFMDTQYVSFNDFSVTRLDLVSYDGTFKKSYFIKVNVHRVCGDTIYWQYRAKDLFETSEVADQRVECLGESLLWFREFDKEGVKLSSADIANVKEWSEQQSVVSPEIPEVSTILLWNNTFFAVGKNSSLLTSADGKTWDVVDTGINFVNILGVQYASKKYDAHLHAIVREGDDYRFARTFDGNAWEIGDVLPETFPVKNYSRPISDEARPALGNVTSRLYIVGGETADGTVVSSTWSCDGTSWAEFQQPFLPAMTRPAIVQYTLNIDNPKSFWLMWSGILADGSVNNKLYFSENRGVTWKPLEKEYKKYSVTSEIIPVGGVSAVMNPKDYTILFFGGVDAEGVQKADVFGGQLIRLTFKKQK